MAQQQQQQPPPPPQQLRRRSALAEIPVRMGLLRVSTDDPDILMHHNITVLDSPNANIPNSYLSPAPSPDELVIRQRGIKKKLVLTYKSTALIIISGRRRISLNWSPEKTTPNRPETPTSRAQQIISTPMTLRSSPRKRLLLLGGDVTGGAGGGSAAAASSPTTPKTPQKSQMTSPSKAAAGPSGAAAAIMPLSSPSSKRLRWDDKPVAQQNDRIPLNTMLKGLGVDQLLAIIAGLVKDEPALEQKIRSNLPAADIRPLEAQLNTMKKNIFKSLPASRLIKKTESNAYTRAATHVAAFKKTVVDQSRVLHDAHHWDALLDYSMMAWHYVKSTPVWDNHSHNSMRRQCFKLLTAHCLAALKYGGAQLGEQRLQEFSGRLNAMAVDGEDISTCSSTLNKLIMTIRQQ